MSNLLVTGGAGFIGSNFIRHVLDTDQSAHIVNLDALTYAGSPKNLADLPNPDRYIFVHGDICDSQLALDLLRRHQIDTIVHFPAETHVDRSILGPAPFIQTNIIGTFSLLEAARKVWLAEQTRGKDVVRFHHVSTDEVYGSLGPSDPPFSETTPYAPSSLAQGSGTQAPSICPMRKSWRISGLLTGTIVTVPPFSAGFSPCSLR